MKHEGICLACQLAGVMLDRDLTPIESRLVHFGMLNAALPAWEQELIHADLATMEIEAETLSEEPES
jgi:hypothetical protein